MEAQEVSGPEGGGMKKAPPARKPKREPVTHTLFRKHLAELGLTYCTETLFHPIREWRWDFSLVNCNIAIEICGQIWHKGGHSSGRGIQRDYDKGNAGTMLGWRVLHFSTDDILRGRAKAFLQQHLRQT